MARLTCTANRTSSAITGTEQAEPTHINLYSPSSLKVALRDAGFDIRRSPDAPRPFLGGSKAAKYIGTALLRLTPSDRLSATANCIAVKPCGVPGKEPAP